MREDEDFPNDLLMFTRCMWYVSNTNNAYFFPGVALVGFWVLVTELFVSKYVRNLKYGNSEIRKYLEGNRKIGTVGQIHRVIRNRVYGISLLFN